MTRGLNWLSWLDLHDCKWSHARHRTGGQAAAGWRRRAAAAVGGRGCPAPCRRRKSTRTPRLRGGAQLGRSSTLLGRHILKAGQAGTTPSTAACCGAAAHSILPTTRPSLRALLRDRRASVVGGPQAACRPTCRPLSLPAAPWRACRRRPAPPEPPSSSKSLKRSSDRHATRRRDLASRLGGGSGGAAGCCRRPACGGGPWPPRPQLPALHHRGRHLLHRGRHRDGGCAAPPPPPPLAPTRRRRLAPARQPLLTPAPRAPIPRSPAESNVTYQLPVEAGARGFYDIVFVLRTTSGDADLCARAVPLPPPPPLLPPAARAAPHGC